MGIQEEAKTNSGRYKTDENTKRIVWIRAAGHCELCGADLMYDYRIGKDMKWGEVAHILPASPKGPRAGPDHDGIMAELLTNDIANLMLLCPSCHDQIDRDADGYPENDLSELHQTYLARIREAATAAKNGRAVAVIVLGRNFQTPNDIFVHNLKKAMLLEGLTAFDHPIKLTLPAPGQQGRDADYWQRIRNGIYDELVIQLQRKGGVYGDSPTLAVVGLADIPALILLGQALGDRCDRRIFSFDRQHELRWPDLSAKPPDFLFTPPTDGEGPLALVLSISAEIPIRDVEAALPGARIAILTVPEPNYAIVKNRSVIHAFRNELQMHLSKLEAETADTIHVFAAIPAAFAIEFGALLTTQYQHPYLIFDRNKYNRFIPTLPLGYHIQETN